MEREGLQQISDEGALGKIIDEVIAANPKQVEQYRGGKTDRDRIPGRPGDEGEPRPGRSGGGESAAEGEAVSACAGKKQVLSALTDPMGTDRSVRAASWMKGLPHIVAPWDREVSPMSDGCLLLAKRPGGAFNTGTDRSVRAANWMKSLTQYRAALGQGVRSPSDALPFACSTSVVLSVLTDPVGTDRCVRAAELDETLSHIVAPWRREVSPPDRMATYLLDSTSLVHSGR